MAQSREKLLAVFTLASLTHPLPALLPLPQQMHVGKTGCRWNWDVAPIQFLLGICNPPASFIFPTRPRVVCGVPILSSII